MSPSGNRKKDQAEVSKPQLSMRGNVEIDLTHSAAAAEPHGQRARRGCIYQRCGAANKGEQRRRESKV